jgi:Flp pilus assembly protein TadG
MAATVVEFAIVAPAVFLIVLIIVIGSYGVYRYQQVAHLARDGSRYASTHGGQYHLDGIDTATGVAQVSTSADVNSYLLTKINSLDPSQLTVTASWSAPAGVSPTNMPTYVDSSAPIPAESTIRNYVTVTVTYQWLPEFLIVGPITLTSTSTMPISY